MEGFDDSGRPLTPPSGSGVPKQPRSADSDLPDLPPLHGQTPTPAFQTSPLPFYAPLPPPGPPPAASVPTPTAPRPPNGVPQSNYPGIPIPNAANEPAYFLGSSPQPASPNWYAGPAAPQRAPPNGPAGDYAQWPPPKNPQPLPGGGLPVAAASAPIQFPSLANSAPQLPPAVTPPTLLSPALSSIPAGATLNATSNNPPTTNRFSTPAVLGRDSAVPSAPAPAAPSAASPPLVDFLCQTPLFQGCHPAQLEKLPRHVEVLEFPSGSTILKAGVANDWLGVLFHGRATAYVVQPSTGSTCAFGTLQRGDYFGEVSVLSGASSPFTISADEACRVLRFPAAIIAKLAHHSASFGDVLSRRLAAQTIRLMGISFPQAPAAAASVPPELAKSTAVDTATPASRAETKPPRSPFAVTPLGITSTTPLKIPYVEVSDYDVQPKLLSILPAKLMLQYRLLPLKLNGQTLTIGMVTPKNPAALAELRNVLATFELDVVAIGADDFSQAAARLKLDDSRSAKQTKRGVVAINPDSIVFDSAESDREPEGNIRQEDPTKLVNRIIAAGLERDASDIHIETNPDGVRVRYRVNGVLQDGSEPIPATSAKSISSRIKVLAAMDITDRRLPQDGRIGLNIGRRGIDLRVSTLPANRGEKIVMRILEAAGSMRPLDQIFIEPGIAEAVRRSLNRPFGGIVIAGPTGSGKSSSMYSMLAERKKARPDTNIVTVEDPIEYRLQGVTQVQVNGAIGLGFPQVLRSMLRQDPDVIVVGETRDEETAKLALEGAITGHLLLTSLHANTTLAAIQRVESLGCSRALISQSLALVLVQRLVRRLCQQCLQMDTPPQALLDVLIAKDLIRPSEKPLIPRSVGCDACNKSGFSGRAVVLEALQITDEIRNQLSAGNDLAEIGRIATQTGALISFRQYAAFLVSKNLISASDALLTVAD